MIVVTARVFIGFTSQLCVSTGGGILHSTGLSGLDEQVCGQIQRIPIF